MQDILMINNMYAAYSATSSYSEKNLSDLSKLVKERGAHAEKREAAAEDKTMQMDRLVISSEALELLKKANA